MSAMEKVKGHVGDNKGKYGLAAGAAIGAGAMKGIPAVAKKVGESEIGKNVGAAAKNVKTYIGKKVDDAGDTIKKGFGSVKDYATEKSGSLLKSTNKLLNN
jgi:hypothetical protein